MPNAYALGLLPEKQQMHETLFLHPYDDSACASSATTGASTIKR
jgi:hypothetical protein